VSVPEGASEAEQLTVLLDEVNRRVVALYEPAALTGKDLVTAGRQQRTNGPGWDVTLGFNQQGGEAFARLTQTIAGSGRLLGIVLDGRSISEASVGQEFAAAGIAGGAASITGNFKRPKRPATSKCSCGEARFPCRSGSSRSAPSGPPSGLRTCAAA